MSAVKVGSEALIELQNSLQSLAEALSDIGDLLGANLSALNEHWCDRQFESYEEAFRPNIEKCNEIASRYLEWNSKVLLPMIEHVIKMEQSPVEVDGMLGAGVAASGKSSNPLSNGTPQATTSSSKETNEALNAANQKLKTPNGEKTLGKEPIENLTQVGNALDGIKKKQDWFEYSIKLDSNVRKGSNGQTDGMGNISLDPKIAEDCVKALEKIRKGEECSFWEERALATLWHELTHNRHKGLESPGPEYSISRRYMEMANEFVARNTFDQFFEAMGGELKCKGLMVYRDNTAYNLSVVKYQDAINAYGLDKSKVVKSVSDYLFNNDYSSQDIGLAKALADNSDGKISYKMAESIVRKCLK